MVTVNCFIEPICGYSDEHNAFIISEYTWMIAYNNASFCAELKQEKDLLQHFKQLLRDQYNLLPEKILFKFVESPDNL